ncbi:hypothetical protein EST38_g128 [Candolleomyces aberdarensis]|uniref:Rho-GAP domain-containing protein n=1 Tax=Candolleomyces aberdarensis TaxID=2316362 RepID=A0A4V1Q5I4_9AGAR|nr:hypothetical protein EST38_g128 [Candolleomyces aberdarensis]
MSLNRSESPDSAPFGLLKASFSKFQTLNYDGCPESKAGYRRSSVDYPQFDSTGRDYPRRRQSHSHRRSSVPQPLRSPPDSLENVPSIEEEHKQTILSLVQEISDFAPPRKARGRPRAKTLPLPLASPPVDCFRKPDPKLVINALSQLSHIGASATRSRLDVHEQMIIHQLDQIDAEERRLLRSGGSLAPSSFPVKGGSNRAGSGERAEREGGPSKDLSSFYVFGVPLRKSGIYASTSVLLGGRELELPIVVVSCVEELYRTGLYQPSLFHTLPDPNRLRELVDAFNHEEIPGDIIITPRPKAAKRRLGTAFGGHISLHLENTSDICSLLSTYLMSLPEPVFIQGNSLFDAMWDWCEVSCDDPVGGDVSYDGNHVPFVHSNVGQASEDDRIRTAQLVLHLLPSPNFDLLVYLLAFFSQVVLAEKDNGLGIMDVARMFGEYLFGHDALESGGSGRQGTGKRRGSVSFSVSPGSEVGRGPRMMRWLLKRWGRLSRHLFDIPRLLDQTVYNPEIRPPTSPNIPFALQGEVSSDPPFDGDPDDAITQSFSDLSSTYTYTKDLSPGMTVVQDRSKSLSISPQTGGKLPSHAETTFRATSTTIALGGDVRQQDIDIDTFFPECELTGSPEEFAEERAKPQPESPRQVNDLLEDILKSCDSANSISRGTSKTLPTTAGSGEMNKISTKAKLPSRIPVVVLPLQVKGKDSHRGVAAVDGHHTPDQQTRRSSIMIPVMSLQKSGASTINSTSDLCDRLMDISIAELVEGGPDPTAIILQNTQRTKDNEIPVRAKPKHVPQPQPQIPVHRIEKLEDRAGSDESGISRRVGADGQKDLSQLQEELRVLKEQNAQALNALEKATRQISSLEAKLKVANPSH